jgi:hypothetical protein
MTHGPERLVELHRAAAELGATDIAGAVAALQGRRAEGRFYVACAGQFKRGKSTLINSLFGDEVLPVGVVPVTSVVTIVRHGPRTARINRRLGGRKRTRAVSRARRLTDVADHFGARVR